MNIDLLIENLQNPALLFFILGIVAVLLKSDLEIPPNTSKFISLYLLFAIGFKGGNELRHEAMDQEVMATILFGLGSAVVIPIVTFFLLKRVTTVFNAGAIAKHAFTNGSVLLILGSLLIGLLANEQQAEGIKPFTNDIFKGFLVLFLLDMGITSGRNLKGFLKGGIVPILFALLMPLLIGVTIAMVSGWFSSDPSDRFILAILGASASYIAVPAAMKMAVPRADPGLYLPMALAITFPVNITIGLPLYFSFVEVVV